jgi:hypothetical protein
MIFSDIPAEAFGDKQIWPFLGDRSAFFRSL